MAIGTPTERKATSFAAQTATTAFSPASTIAAGTVALLFACCNTTKKLSSVTDTAGNTWVVDVADNPTGAQCVSVASCQVATQITTGGTITATWSSATSGTCDIWVEEVTGLAASSVFDKKVSATGTGTAASSGSLATLAQTSEIVWGLFRTNNGQTGNSVGSGFTQATTFTLEGNAALLEYQIVAATTGIPAALTLGASGTWSALAAAYKGVASSPPSNTGAPVVSGTATLGSTLTTTNGTWTDAGSPAFTYQWQRDVLGNASYSNIAAATASTYVLTLLDDSCNVRCVVTDTDVNGATPANSNGILDLTDWDLQPFVAHGRAVPRAATR